MDNKQDMWQRNSVDGDLLLCSLAVERASECMKILFHDQSRAVTASIQQGYGSSWVPCRR